MINNKLYGSLWNSMELYGNRPTISSAVQQRRMRFAGHCVRASNQPAEKLWFCTPNEGKAQKGGVFKTKWEILAEPTGLKSNKEI